MPKLAHKIGSLLFCPDCGTLLNLPRDDETEVACEQCGYLEPASSYENIEIVTKSHPDAFPSALHQKRKTQTKVHEGETLLKVTEKCPECGHMEAYSKEMQTKAPRFSTPASSANTAGELTIEEKGTESYDECQVIWKEQTQGKRDVIASESGPIMLYTYTPTEQNSATTPKPPRRLAVLATKASAKVATRRMKAR
ncbi:hypothetical protein NLI96_g4769 [Meripilus lineatus]|uniref:DNA-directed RNA polymerase II subunit RPB9-like zinc ribbon domain-containing protein n=1 Tax=Meripilus lineatus TaxID=2056292 RepID=A0AAD5YJL2_9APHY|nr:hypothetical protein NLI96_g4769 [Physisporinus lineatus]